MTGPADELVEVAEVYLAITDGPFAFADGEVVDSLWVPLADVPGWSAERAICPDALALVLPRLS